MNCKAVVDMVEGIVYDKHIKILMYTKEKRIWIEDKFYIMTGDVTMGKFEFAPMCERIKKIREKRDIMNSAGCMKINSERTKLYTDYYKAHENEYPILKRSGALLDWCSKKEANVFDDDIFVGTLGPCERSMSPYVDINVRWIPNVLAGDDEEFRKAWQSPNSIYMSFEQREIFREAYEYWRDRNLSSMVEGAMTEDYWEAIGNGSILTERSRMKGFSGSPQGHYIANFNKVVNVGFGAVKREVKEKIEALRGKVFGNDAEKLVFYHSVVCVCDGAITLSKRYAASCRAKAQTAEESRKAELLWMADSLEWIMENPARTFWEGLQAIILYQLMLSTDAQQHGQSIGRADQYVGHLLKKQLDEGGITMETAQMYTDAFILRLSDIISMPRVPDNKYIIGLIEKGQSVYSEMYNGGTPTAGIALTLGGVKRDGSDACCEATYCFLQTYGRMHFPDPTVALRISSSTPDEIWRLGIESSKLCGGIPQLQNDEVIIKSLTDTGMAIEDARDYSIVGCVEPAGTGNEWPACGSCGSESIWNMLDVVLLTVNGGVYPPTGKMAVPVKKLYEYESFEEFKEAFATEMKYVLDWSVSYTNTFEMVFSHYFPCIAASTMMEGCIENGRDVTKGGAKYNRTGLTAIGTANVGDSLYAIKKLCFDDKSVALQDMYDALKNNWQGYDELHDTIVRKLAHYGNDIDDVDELAAWALGLFAETMSSKEGPRGKYSGGTFTMTAHMFYGTITPATPDGRFDFDPLADAISPRQGFDKNGPTAYLKSAAKLPQRALTNGDQLNIRFTPKSVEGEEGAKKLRALISTYFRMGGMQVQFNVVGSETLRSAQEKPEEHKGLVVRIAGFSTYFVTLSKKTQDDFITRTEQQL